MPSPESPGLLRIPMQEFLARLASGDPTPGGGAAAALTAALAAGLARMVCALTLNRPRFAAVETQILAIQEVLTHAADMLSVLVDEDAQAYAAFAAALRLDKNDPSRARRIEESASIAAAVPLQTAMLARRVERLAQELTRIGNPTLKADVESAIHLSRAAIGAASANVRCNLPFLTAPDRTRVEHELASLAGT